MPKNLIDKFMKIYHERKEIKGETQIKMFEVNQFLKTMDIIQLKKEFNYNTNKELADAIGIGASQLYKLNDVDNLSDNTKFKVYNFFNNPLNIRYIDKKQTNKKSNCVENHTKEQGQEIINFLLHDKKMSIKEISTTIGVHNSTISNWSRGTYGISDMNYEKLCNIANKKINTNKDTDNIVNTEEIIENVVENNKPIATKCLLNTDEHAVLLKLLDELTSENITLKTQILRYEKLIDRM